ncbi:MAG: hypothetical protein AAF721_11820 [Myxococcota bacterium]
MLALAGVAAVGCRKSASENAQDANVEGFAYEDLGPVMVCVGDSFDTVLTLADGLNADILKAVITDNPSFVAKQGVGLVDMRTRRQAYECLREGSGTITAEAMSGEVWLNAATAIECVTCEGTSSGAPDPTGSVDSEPTSDGSGSTGGPGDSADPVNDCENTDGGRDGCGIYDYVDFVDAVVTCDGGLTVEVTVAGLIEQDPGFEGRLQFSLTANGVLDGEALYTSVQAISDDAGPFMFSGSGPFPVELGPDDAFTVDGETMTIHLSDATLTSTGGTFDSIDLQSFVSDDAAGASVGDDLRGLPWGC